MNNNASSLSLTCANFTSFDFGGKERTHHRQEPDYGATRKEAEIGWRCAHVAAADRRRSWQWKTSAAAVSTLDKLQINWCGRQQQTATMMMMTMTTMVHGETLWSAHCPQKALTPHWRRITKITQCQWKKKILQKGKKNDWVPSSPYYVCTYIACGWRWVHSPSLYHVTIPPLLLEKKVNKTWWNNFPNFT